MHPAPLKQLEERLYSQMPLIGGCLRQRTAQALARDGSPDAVRILAKAFARSDDRQVLAIALDALRQIRKQQCIDEVCAVWAVTRHTDLANLLIKKSWVASAPVDVKVMSALKAGQLEVVTKGGAEIVEPLLKAFSDTDNEIASRANQYAIAIANPDAVDYLCERWSKTRDKLLEQLILQGKYVAGKPIEVRVLSALKMERLEVLKQGGAEVALPLLQAYQDADCTIAKNAQLVLKDLQNSEPQESLCYLVIHQEHQLACKVAVECQYTPRNPDQLALFYFLSEQWNKYESLDFEHTLLQTAYELGSKQLRKRIADKAKKAGRIEWVQVVTGGHKWQRLGQMTVAEWENTLALLTQGRHWEKMWQLAQKAPAIWSAELLNRICQSQWTPTKEEQAGFADLINLAKNVSGKLPEKAHIIRCRVINSFFYSKYEVFKKRRDRLQNRFGIILKPQIQLISSLSISSNKNFIFIVQTQVEEVLKENMSNLEYEKVNVSVIHLWDVKNWCLVKTLKAGSYTIHLHAKDDLDCKINVASLKGRVAISSDGKLLATLRPEVEKKIFFPTRSIPYGRARYNVEPYKIEYEPELWLLWRLPDGQPIDNVENTFLASTSDWKKVASSWEKWESFKVVQLGLRSLPTGWHELDHSLIEWQKLPHEVQKTWKNLANISGHLAVSNDKQIIANVKPDGVIQVYTLEDPTKILQLCSLPIRQLTLSDIEWIKMMLEEGIMPESEQAWLKFLFSLLRWQQQFDIEVEDTPQQINYENFDIEIEC